MLAPPRTGGLVEVDKADGPVLVNDEVSGGQISMGDTELARLTDDMNDITHSQFSFIGSSVLSKSSSKFVPIIMSKASCDESP